MTTPPPDTQPAAETLDAIADRIAYKYLDRTVASAKLKSDILSALRNERERAAKLADGFARRLRTVGPHSVAAGVEVLASEIRSGKESKS